MIAAIPPTIPSTTQEASSPAWAFCGRPAPDQPVTKVALSAEIFSLGRDEQNRFCLRNQTVSSRHAELISLADGVVVRDLGSTNGTYLNGQRVEGSVLAGPGDILQFGSSVFHLESLDPAAKPITEKWDVADDSVGRLQFAKLFERAGIVPFYQPIIRLETLERVGFEALARSQLTGLESPRVMFKVAAERNAEIELSRLMRKEALHLARQFSPDEPIYLNTHPLEIQDPAFLSSLEELRRTFPDQAMVLEIHEAAVTDLTLLRRIRSTLQDLSIGLSYDDFGAGQARLLELVEVPPDVLKFDIQLIRDLPNASKERQRLLECLLKVTKEMNILALAECVETALEVEVCQQIGFDLAQGFCLGRPAPIEQWIP